MLGSILKLLKFIAKFIMVMNTLGILDDMLGTIADTIDSFEETTVADDAAEETTIA